MLDFNSKYLVPMSKITDPERTETLVECSIKRGHKSFELICTSEGYRTKGFYTDYFAHLVQKGYAQKVLRYPTYFEATYKNTLAGYTCKSLKAYQSKLSWLAGNYKDLELVYREWDDGTVENGTIKKEDWNI